MSTFYAKYPVDGGGVTSLDNLTGALTLVAGTGISITDNGTDEITIASTSAGDLTLTAFGSAPNANGASLSGQALTLQPADATHPGGVSTTTQSFGGDKTFTGAISASNLSGTNTGDVTLGTANGLSLVGQALSLALSSTNTTGALSDTDWNTFNSKQGSGNYITALTGDATASGPGSAALTLATVNSNVGSFGSASSVSAITVNAKGLVTAAASTSIQIAESQVTNLVSDLAGKQATGNYITALTGDGTASGPNSVALTLATVNSNVGTFTYATLTVNAKGLVTAASSGAAPVTTLAAVGASPNANGASISSNTLTLQPADGSNPGVITSGTQTIGGAKTFSNGVTAASLTLSSTTGIVGTTTNNDAAAGSVGEFLSANLVAASAVSLTNNTFATVTSISLTAGDWDVWGFVGVNFTGASTRASGGISSVTNAFTPFSNQIDGFTQIQWASTIDVTGQRLSVSPVRVSVASTTTAYLIAQSLFSTNASSAFGTIMARRVR